MMTLKVMFLCCLFVFSMCREIQSAEMGVLQIKSNSPAAPFLGVAKSTTFRHRTKRGTSGSRLTFEERVDFLNAHNNYRANVQPGAADMQFMMWHEELAEMAQEWADRCVWEYGNPARDPKPYDTIGQNLFRTTAATVTGTQATASWYSEAAYYTLSTNTCADNKVCGNYTQVVWATSFNLGCAVANCPVLINSPISGTSQFVVCNYGPGGNYVGQKPYTAGFPAQLCPAGTISDNTLCFASPKCGNKICENSGTLDGESCECQCMEWYNGATCTIVSGDAGGSDNDDGGSDNDHGGSGNDDESRTAGQSHVATPALFLPMATCLLTVFTVFKTY